MSGLLVPVEGYTEIIEHDHPLTEEWITRVFAQHGSDGKLVAIELRDPLEVLTGNVFLTICDQPENQRARSIMATLTTLHIVFHGPVLFDGLEQQTIIDVLEVI